MSYEDESLDLVKIFKDQTGKWRWYVQSNNGNIIATSPDGYKKVIEARGMARRLFPQLDIQVES